MDGDSTSDYATLIHYTSVSTLAPYSSTNYNYDGPIDAYKVLPSTTQWSNVTLSKETRQLYNDFGGTTVENPTFGYDENNEWGVIELETKKLPKFTYTNKAARLLSIKEMNAMFNDGTDVTFHGALGSKNFLLENTHYSNEFSDNNNSWWLENPQGGTIEGVSDIISMQRAVSGTNPAGLLSIRPVIEVPLKDISY